MERIPRSTWIALAFAAGFAAHSFASRSSDALAQAPVPPPGPAFEYSVVPISGKTSDAIATNQTETLNTMARQGWRFFEVSSQPTGAYLFFERPARKR